MRATLNIPDDLIAEVQELSGEKSKTKAIVTAMQEYIREKKVKMLLDLRGKIQIDYDWQKIYSSPPLHWNITFPYSPSASISKAYLA